jgi:hypothetical protein
MHTQTQTLSHHARFQFGLMQNLHTYIYTNTGGHARFQFGLMQHRIGPCGVLAAVQAQVFSLLLWPDGSDQNGGLSDHMDLDWDALDREVFKDVSTHTLAAAISHILWRCRPEGSTHGAKLVTVENGPLQFGPSSWESLRVIDCPSFDQLQAMACHILDMYAGAGGVVLLVYSAVLTRGIELVVEEAGNSSNSAGYGRNSLNASTTGGKKGGDGAHNSGKNAAGVGSPGGKNNGNGGTLFSNNNSLLSKMGVGTSNSHNLGASAGKIVYTLVVMEGGQPFCEQSLVNLLLTGSAVPTLEPKVICYSACMYVFMAIVFDLVIFCKMIKSVCTVVALGLLYLGK